MKALIALPLFALLAASFPSPPRAEAAGEVTRRFALVAGSNNGGGDRVRLRYALSDAFSFMAVVKKLGGVDDTSAVLLSEPGRAGLMAALADMRNRTAAAKKRGGRVEFIFYYSGHSDEEGLLPRGEKLPYRDLRDAVTRMPADVRIAVLDSCSSGAFTRVKGGKMRSPFLVDRSHNMRGVAFMTSSSASEASQESDRIGASFFTHFLVTGLRGAADSVRDGRVTLNEAYQYAYAETLARTEKTLRGAQHPNYHIMMSGAGDVVLTDLRRSNATLVLPPALEGRIRIRDGSRTLVAEFSKRSGKEMSLGLDSGRYSVLNERGRDLYETTLVLKSGERHVLNAGAFTVAERERAIARGDADGDEGMERREEKLKPVIQEGGFIDAKVRVAAYIGAAVPWGGYMAAENHLIKAMRADLVQAYLSPAAFRVQSYQVSGGGEIDGLFPSIKYLQTGPFSFTALKFGLRARYGHQTVENMLMTDSLFGGENQKLVTKSSGRVLRYNYWSAGPVMNVCFTPVNNFGGLALGFFATAGQIFGGRLTAAAVYRDSGILALWTIGAYGQGAPASRLDLARALVHNRMGNTTVVRGYTFRFGGGPEFFLNHRNKRPPLTVGIRATYSYSRLFAGKPLTAYMNGRKAFAVHEAGAELSAGAHF